MSNNWGRNNQVERAGSSNMLLPAVLIVLFVLAGAYGWYARQAMLTQIDTLQTQLAQARSDADATRSTIAQYEKSANASAGDLEKELADLKLTEIPRLGRLLDARAAEISQLRNQLETKTNETTQSSTQVTGLQRDLTAALKKTVDLSDEVEGLSLRNTALTARIAELEAALQQKAATPEALPRQSDQRDVEIDRLGKALTDAQRTISELKIRTDAQPAAAPTGEQAPTPAAGPSPAAENATPRSAPRDRQAVNTALENTRGLGLLNDAQTEGLRDKLASGACVTVALQDVLKRVPLVLMRNLMRDLGTDC